jgi:3',5'-cyclic-AMP phosphodiesterase
MTTRPMTPPHSNERRMKLILFSDPHMTTGRAICGRSPAEWLRRAIAHAAEHHPDADACILLGDLVDSGTRAEYLALRDELSTLPFACRLMLGNHDDRDAFLDVFAPVETDQNGFLQTTQTFGRMSGIFLDTLSPGESAGSLDGGRLEWLAARLGEASGPCLIFLHHPPIATGMPAFEEIGLKNRVVFQRVIADHRQHVAALFFGHCHMSVAGTIAGVPAFGVRSLVCQSLPNFRDRRFLNAPGLPPAYSVVLMDNGALTIHAVEFGYDGLVEVSL